MTAPIGRKAPKVDLDTTREKLTKPGTRNHPEAFFRTDRPGLRRGGLRQSGLDCG